MTFEQADNLTERIIAFLISTGGPYPDISLDYLQRSVLMSLAAGQFIMEEDEKGIRYFISYWMLDKESLEEFLPVMSDHRIMPTNAVSGDYMYVSEVGSRGEVGDARKMIRRLRQKEEHRIRGCYWHQHKRNNRVCKCRES
jgi:hemolysin-activating ACP:hemolysin acyltransferase